MGSSESVHYSLPALPEAVSPLELPHLGAVTLMRTDRGLCLRKCFPFADCFLMEERMRRLQVRANKLANSPHVLNIYGVRRRERKELCASSYELEVYIEHCEGTLH